jgi:zinc protease
MSGANRKLLAMAPVAAFTVATMLALAAPRAHALEIKRMTLKNGAVLLVSEAHQLPMVTLSIAFDAGSRRDLEGKEGLAALTAESIREGSKSLSADELNRKVDFMGSELSVSAGRDYASAGFTSLKRYLPDTLRLLAGVLTDPGLRDADILRKRAELVAAIKADEEQPGYTAEVTFLKHLFGKSPYGHPVSGSAESVAKLTPEDVRRFYHDHYRLDGAVIAVAGDVTADEIKAALEKELTGLQGKNTPQAEPPEPKVGPGLHVNLIDRNVAQANIILGFGGVARSNPDYYKLTVMNYVLGGGGFASRLVQTVRSKAGLAYSVSSGFDAGKFPGSFSVGLQTKNQSANQALALVLKQMREMQEKPVADTELDGAKRFLIGSFPLKIDRQAAIAGFMQQVELYGLGLDYADRYPKIIAAITKDDVLNVAREYLHPDAAIVIAVANQKEAAIKTGVLSKEAAGGSSAN